jgi:hypothetical protein
MSILEVKPIPSKEWKEPIFGKTLPYKNRQILTYDRREKERKRNPEKVKERIYYMWFHYLKLGLNLEDIKHTIEKRGRGGTILSKTKVRVSKSIYRKWDLQEVRTSSFYKWYKNPKHQKLFTEGGFTYSRGCQYHSLVKRYNVFITYHNKMNTEYEDVTGGERSKKSKLCEDIVKKFQITKVRYEVVEGDRRNPTRTKEKKTSFQSMVLNDINDCEKTILSVCQGEFPKSKSV